MKSTSENTFNQLRISQAYLKLLSIPENACGREGDFARADRQTTRFACSNLQQIDSADGPLFWMELFDHDGQSSVDSCCCYEIEEAAAAFDGFVGQANELGRLSPVGRDEPGD